MGKKLATLPAKNCGVLWGFLHSDQWSTVYKSASLWKHCSFPPHTLNSQVIKKWFSPAWRGPKSTPLWGAKNVTACMYSYRVITFTPLFSHLQTPQKNRSWPAGRQKVHFWTAPFLRSIAKSSNTFGMPHIWNRWKCCLIFNWTLSSETPNLAGLGKFWPVFLKTGKDKMCSFSR